jgi:hypothetical protein
VPSQTPVHRIRDVHDQKHHEYVSECLCHRTAIVPPGAPRRKGPRRAAARRPACAPRARPALEPQPTTAATIPGFAAPRAPPRTEQVRQEEPRRRTRPGTPRLSRSGAPCGTAARRPRRTIPGASPALPLGCANKRFGPRRPDRRQDEDRERSPVARRRLRSRAFGTLAGDRFGHKAAGLRADVVRSRRGRAASLRINHLSLLPPVKRGAFWRMPVLVRWSVIAARVAAFLQRRPEGTTSS